MTQGRSTEVEVERSKYRKDRTNVYPEYCAKEKMTIFQIYFVFRMTVLRVNKTRSNRNFFMASFFAGLARSHETPDFKTKN